MFRATRANIRKKQQQPQPRRKGETTKRYHLWVVTSNILILRTSIWYSVPGICQPVKSVTGRAKNKQKRTHASRRFTTTKKGVLSASVGPSIGRPVYQTSVGHLGGFNGRYAAVSVLLLLPDARIAGHFHRGQHLVDHAQPRLIRVLRAHLPNLHTRIFPRRQ